MYHGFILNAIKFGLEAACDYPKGASDQELKELASWLSVYPNDGTYESFLDSKRHG